jgi:hypothetical protein
MANRIFVFKGIHPGLAGRHYLHAFPENAINSVETQIGSENVRLVINGIEVIGSFDKFVKQLGERINTWE